MAAIRVAQHSDTPSFIARDVADEATRAKLSEGELDSRVRTMHPGSAEELQLFEVAVPPNGIIDQHAHDSDEIVYVVEGELLLGSRTLIAGESVYVPGNTLYALRAGESGLRFLNFHRVPRHVVLDEVGVHVPRRAAGAQQRP